MTKTANGESPLVHGTLPLPGVDVWKHSYYIDYRNARLKYLEAWFDNLRELGNTSKNCTKKPAELLTRLNAKPAGTAGCVFLALFHVILVVVSPRFRGRGGS